MQHPSVAKSSAVHLDTLGPAEAVQLPKIIHHTWKHPYLAEPLQRCVDSFRKLNPGWKLRFYNDEECEDFVRRVYPDFYPFYLKYPRGIFRADIFRVLALHHFGGVYADIDVECRRPLDELLLSVDESDWEVILTTDHPIHENVHFGGRRMWMNDFIIAKPAARFFDKVIAEFKRRAKDYTRPENAVEATGPGLFTKIMEQTESDGPLGVVTLPWKLVHPIPDLTISFPEKAEVEQSVIDGSWKSSDPYVVHYWYHTWIGKPNTLTKYKRWLLQSNGEIIERRLQSYIDILGDRIDTVGRALAEFGQTNHGVIASFESQKGFPSRECEELRSDTFDAEDFLQIARTVCVNLDVRIFHVRCTKEQTKSDLCAHWDDRAGLIYIGSSTAHRIIDEQLLKPGGLVLIENDEGNSDFSAALELFEANQFEVLESGTQLLMRLPNAPIPKVIHVISGRLRGAPSPIISQKWLQLHADSGWEVRYWPREKLDALVAQTAPSFYDVYLSWRDESSRSKVAALFVLAKMGGVVTEDTFACQVALDEAVREHKLVFFSKNCKDAKELTDHLMAGIPNHPFWQGLVFDLTRWRERHGDSFDEKFLNRRAHDCERFLTEEQLPVALVESSIPDSAWSHSVPPATKDSNVPSLKSRLCNEIDFGMEWFQLAVGELGEALRYHRKQWEHGAIFGILLSQGLLTKQHRGLAYVSGLGPLLPAMLNRGCNVTVVDVEPMIQAVGTFQTRMRRISEQKSAWQRPTGSVDNERIYPTCLDTSAHGQYHFVFSPIALQLFPGEYQAAKRFIFDALAMLRPGGLAVFTAEYCLSTEAEKDTERKVPFTENELKTLRNELEANGWILDLDLNLGHGEIESYVDQHPPTGGPHLRVQVSDTVRTSVLLVIRDARTAHTQRESTTTGSLPRSKMRGYVNVGIGGLRDVARRFYLTSTYDLLSEFREPTAVICFSHNPGALDFFRFHPNNRNIILFDMGAMYMSLLQDKRLDYQEVIQRVINACGFSPTDQLARPCEPKPIKWFPAPDALKEHRGHIVLHPFGRGWGDWPTDIHEVVRRVLNKVPQTTKVFVLASDYTAMGGQVKKETFNCDLPNVHIVKNLSAPASFSLVASASRFIGKMSSLSQVAAFENVPSLILHPSRCTDFHAPLSPYGRSVWEHNGAAIPFDQISHHTLEDTLSAFLAEPESMPIVADLFATIAPRPSIFSI